MFTKSKGDNIQDWSEPGIQEKGIKDALSALDFTNLIIIALSSP